MIMALVPYSLSSARYCKKKKKAQVIIGWFKGRNEIWGYRVRKADCFYIPNNKSLEKALHNKVQEKNSIMICWWPCTTPCRSHKKDLLVCSLTRLLAKCSVIPPRTRGDKCRELQGSFSSVSCGRLPQGHFSFLSLVWGMATLSPFSTALLGYSCGLLWLPIKLLGYGLE